MSRKENSQRLNRQTQGYLTLLNVTQDDYLSCLAFGGNVWYSVYVRGFAAVIQEVKFKGVKYKLLLTKHALERMAEREISRSLIIEILETGKAIEKKKKGKWWVYKKVKQRKDNDVCLSVTIESPNLILITTLVNWRPDL